jgi:hypothetical protein
MDLIDYLLQHLSVDKLVTDMKDRGFVLTSTNLQTHFPHAQAHLHLPSSTTHHVPLPPTPGQTLPPQTAPASTQLQQGRERDQPPRQRGTEREREREREREGEKERERVRQTAAAHTPSRARAGPTPHACAGLTTAPPLPLPSQVTGPPSLTPFPTTKGRGAKRKIKAMLCQ